MWKKAAAYVLWITGSEAAGALGAFFTRKSVDEWYRYLKKPSFNPPSSVFGPVWTILYALMGIAAARITLSHHRQKGPALTAFIVQLLLNFLWTVLFFGTRSPRAALIEIFLLLAAIVATMLLFARISKTAALLLAPYLPWTCFAAVLNYYLYKLNRPGEECFPIA
jgi:translocator protein